MKIKNKKIKIELTLDELKIIIDCIGYCTYEYNESSSEHELLKKLEKIEDKNENRK